MKYQLICLGLLCFGSAVAFLPFFSDNESVVVVEQVDVDVVPLDVVEVDDIKVVVQVDVDGPEQDATIHDENQAIAYQLEGKEVALDQVKEPEEEFFIELYEAGKKAYLANDYKTCVTKLESAVKSFTKFNKAIVKCKADCSKQATNDFTPLVTDNIENLHFYERMIRQTLCLMNCHNATAKAMRTQIPREIFEDFDNRLPYDFLQLCYFQLEDYEAAASAAMTFLAYNPDSRIMRDNIVWYAWKLKNETQFVNREPLKHEVPYLAGVVAYSDGDWAESVENFEKAFTEYLTAEEECRLDCEKPFDMGWFPDFVTSVANHFVFCLKCKRYCQTKLGYINGEKIEDILPLILNYLQFSYYKLGNIEKAVECVESFLELDPNDAIMIANRAYYDEKEKSETEWFRVRDVLLPYLKRDQYEQKILEFIETEFSYYNTNKKSKELEQPEMANEAENEIQGKEMTKMDQQEILPRKKKGDEELLEV